MHISQVIKTFFLYGLIALWLFFNISGGMLIKYATMVYDNIFLLSVVIVLLGSTVVGRAVVSMLIGRNYQLSFVYPFLGLNHVVSVILGVWLFNEDFKWQRLIGGCLIVLGVFLLVLSRNKKDAECK